MSGSKNQSPFPVIRREGRMRRQGSGFKFWAEVSDLVLCPLYRADTTVDSLRLSPRHHVTEFLPHLDVRPGFMLYASVPRCALDD